MLSFRFIGHCYDAKENIKKYDQFFTDAPRLPAFEGLTLAHTVEPENDYIGLFENDLISILHLSTREHGWQITYSQTEPEFQRRGCFRYLLTTAVDTHGSILSDEYQSNKAKEAWKSLIKYPGPNLEIFVYDGSNKILSLGMPENEIWNGRVSPVLLIQKTTAASPSRDKIMTRLRETTGIDRTEKGIWYGIASSTTEYDNP